MVTIISHQKLHHTVPLVLVLLQLAYYVGRLLLTILLWKRIQQWSMSR